MQGKRRHGNNSNWETIGEEPLYERKNFVVTDWFIILHGGLSHEFTLKEHKFKGILLKAYEYGKREHDKVIIHLEE